MKDGFYIYMHKGAPYELLELRGAILYTHHVKDGRGYEDKPLSQWKVATPHTFGPIYTAKPWLDHYFKIGSLIEYTNEALFTEML